MPITMIAHTAKDITPKKYKNKVFHDEYKQFEMDGLFHVTSAGGGTRTASMPWKPRRARENHCPCPLFYPCPVF